MKLVSKDLAKKLKDIGFKDQCDHFHIPKYGTTFKHFHTSNQTNFNIIETDNFLVPYIPQAIDWLREEYKVLIYNVYKEFGQIKLPKQLICKIEWVNGNWNAIHGEAEDGHDLLLERGIWQVIKIIGC